MNHEIIQSYINVLGYPVCVSIAVGSALWKLGSRLIDAHFDLVISLKADSKQNAKSIEDIATRINEVAEVVSNWPDPTTICRDQPKPSRNH